MKSSNEFKDIVNKRLEEFFDKKLSSAKYDEEKELISVLKDYTLRGGKRIRAYLIYLSYQGLGGNDFEKAINASLSAELLQSFLLIHDDIMDEDDLRRKGITPHAYYKREYSSLFSEKATHMGNSFAILCGDLAYSYSNELMARTNEVGAIEELNRITAKVIFGQKRDIFANYKDYTSKDLINNYILKTATYTFLGPFNIGARLAGKEADFEEFSNNLGIAFQIQDDLLDVFGNEEILGKPIGSDIKDGKRTILLLKALEKAKGEDKEYLLSIINHGKVLELKKVRDLFTKTGSKEYCEILAEEKYSKALSELKSFDFSSDAEEGLRKIIEKLMNRKY